MNQTIWKYELALDDLQGVRMPYAAQILTVQMQNGNLCLWALVNQDAPRVARTIEIIGTGNPVPQANRAYIGTVQMHEGALVWHVFERAS